MRRDNHEFKTVKEINRKKYRSCFFFFNSIVSNSCITQMYSFKNLLLRCCVASMWETVCLSGNSYLKLNWNDSVIWMTVMSWVILFGVFFFFFADGHLNVKIMQHGERYTFKGTVRQVREMRLFLQRDEKINNALMFVGWIWSYHRQQVSLA